MGSGATVGIGVGSSVGVGTSVGVAVGSVAVIVGACVASKTAVSPFAQAAKTRRSASGPNR